MADVTTFLRREVNICCSFQYLTFLCLIRRNIVSLTVTTAWRVLGLRIEETASRYGG
jgi:hypothetical protein